jgi:hypothetical protein
MAQDRWNEIERWHEIKDKLDAVLKLAPEQRPAYLDQVSTADPELRRELESLIAFHEQAGTDFLNVPLRKPRQIQVRRTTSIQTIVNR